MGSRFSGLPAHMMRRSGARLSSSYRRKMKPSYENEIHSWLAIALLLAFIPLAYLIVMVATYSVDVPFADQWALVPLLEKSYRGTLTLRDLWSQHNEHRLLFPRMIMLVLARLSGWNLRYELAVNIL